MSERVKLLSDQPLTRRQLLGLAAGGAAAAPLFVTPGGPLLASVFSQNLSFRVRNYRAARKRVDEHINRRRYLASYRRVLLAVNEPARYEADLRILQKLKQRKIESIAALMNHEITSETELYLKYGALCEIIERDINQGMILDRLMTYGYLDWLDQLDRDIADYGAPLSPFWRDVFRPYPQIEGVRVLWRGGSRWGGGRFIRYQNTT